MLTKAEKIMYFADCMCKIITYFNDRNFMAVNGEQFACDRMVRNLITTERAQQLLRGWPQFCPCLYVTNT